VHQPDPEAIHLDDASLGQELTQLGRVDVPLDREHRRPERLEVGKGRPRRHVTRVQDEIGSPHYPHADVGQSPRPSRQMSVAEERDQKRPGRKRPPR
jgi:hypothetical protein